VGLLERGIAVVGFLSLAFLNGRGVTKVVYSFHFSKYRSGEKWGN
jgi:hypothetical protein